MSSTLAHQSPWKIEPNDKRRRKWLSKITQEENRLKTRRKKRQKWISEKKEETYVVVKGLDRPLGYRIMQQLIEGV